MKITAEEVRAGITRDVDGEYSYFHEPTRREFLIIREDEGFVIDELVPMPRVFDGWAQEIPRRIPQYRDLPGGQDIKKNSTPNTLVPNLEAVGGTHDNLVRTSMPQPGRPKTLYFSSLEAVADVLSHAIEDDELPRSFREPTMLEKMETEINDARSSIQYCRGTLESLKAAKAKVEETGDLLDAGMSMSGMGWSDEIRASVEQYLENPTQEQWTSLRGLLYLPTTTLWQAWCAVDGDAPRIGGDNGYPSAETLKEAMSAAIDDGLETWAPRVESAERQLETVESMLHGNEWMAARQRRSMGPS